MPSPSDLSAYLRQTIAQWEPHPRVSSSDVSRSTTWIRSRPMPLPRPLLEPIAPPVLAQLYRLSLSSPDCYMTGSTAMGVDTEGSDVDFLVTPELIEELGIDGGAVHRGYTSDTTSLKFIADNGKVINLIVAHTPRIFYAWKFATDNCILLSRTSKEMMRVKSYRIRLFRAFKNYKEGLNE